MNQPMTIDTQTLAAVTGGNDSNAQSQAQSQAQEQAREQAREQAQRAQWETARRIAGQ
jgi:hypothetical protein